MTAAIKPDQTLPLSEVDQLKEKLASSEDKIKWLEEKITWFERQVFGKKSERIVQPENDDIRYLPGLEPENNGEGAPKKQHVPAHTRTKGNKRNPKNDNSNGILIPEGLPVEQTVLDLPEEEKICPETGEKMVKIGEEVTRQLAHCSGHYFVKETIRPKYALPSKEEAGIFIQDLPGGILPRSRVDESLLAEIVTRKFADHLPLYRLSEIFSRDDVQLTRQLLSQWLIRLGNTLSPLCDLMLEEIKRFGVGFVDETPIKLQVKGKGKLQQAYMWVLVGGEGADPPHRVYQFCENRKHQNAFDLMEGFLGIFHSDKYGAYEKLAKRDGLLWQACWAHIRRKFEEATSGDLEFRKMVLRKIRYLFMFERIAWSRDEAERLRIRKEKEEPILDQLIKEIKAKVEEGKLLPKSKFSKALNYAYGLIPYMKTYLTNPYARMDNNVAERAMRSLAIGRKNWLFVGSLQGGKATAVLLSLVQTCRGLGINPREYLEDIMRRFHSHPANRLVELLPDRWAAAHKKEPTPTKPLHIR